MRKRTSRRVEDQINKMKEQITSVKNERVKQWRALCRKAERDDHGCLFFAEGEHMVSEALKEDKAVEIIISEDRTDRFSELAADANRKNIPIYTVSDAVMNAVTDTKTPQGICGVCLIPNTCRRGNERIVALERVQDPGNLGTVLRTMDAFGYDLLLIDRGCAEPCSPKASRASMGAVFRIPVLCVESIPEEIKKLRADGYDVVAGELHGQDLRKVKIKGNSLSCILIGNEGTGLTREALENSNIRVRIPMPGKAESLNAAVAAAVMMYELM